MKKRFPRLSRRWIELALLVTALVVTPVGYGLANGTRVFIDPASRDVKVGETTTVDVKIQDVTGLFGAEVHLKFDPNLLEVVDADAGTDGVQIQPGSFLSPDFMAKNSADQVSGRIVFAVAQMPPHQPVSGNGVLATITFKGRAIGTSPISFETTQPTDPVILSDQSGTQIDTTTDGGSINVTNGPTPTHTPTPTSTPTPTPTGTPPPWTILGTHTVKAGEWLYCIGRAYGVDPYAIATQNRILNPNIIHPGDKLEIPNKPAALPPGKICVAQFDSGIPSPDCEKIHTVAQGETLYSIALKYDGVSMWDIAEANNILNLNYIRVGQELCIP